MSNEDMPRFDFMLDCFDQPSNLEPPQKTFPRVKEDTRTHLTTWMVSKHSSLHIEVNVFLVSVLCQRLFMFFYESHSFSLTNLSFSI